LMIGFLFESKEINADATLRLKQAPAFAALVDAKADRGQNLRIKSLGRLAVFYPEIDMIEKARAHGKVSAAGCGCLLAVLAPDHEFQSGPCLIDGANFHIHKTERQTEVANNVLGDIRRNSGGLLWPRNPDDAGVIDNLAQALQF